MKLANCLSQANPIPLKDNNNSDSSTTESSLATDNTPSVSAFNEITYENFNPNSLNIPTDRNSDINININGNPIDIKFRVIGEAKWLYVFGQDGSWDYSNGNFIFNEGYYFNKPGSSTKLIRERDRWMRKTGQTK